MIERATRVFKRSIKINGLLKTLNYFVQIFFIKVSIREYIIINRNTKIYLRNKTSDIPVFRQIFLEGEYKFNYKGDINNIIDAGANIGLASIYFTLLFPYSKIICIEPESANFKVLLKNIGQFKNITAIQGGIWYKDEVLQINPSEKFGEWGYQLSKVHGPIEDESNTSYVSSWTIDYLMERYNFSEVDILKIDIEGAEREIFINGDIKKWLPHCKYVVIEIHEFMYPGLSKNIVDTIEPIIPFDSFSIGENTYIINKDRL